jgi:antitoxin component of MazEF toxin-antitoxin module
MPHHAALQDLIPQAIAKEAEGDCLAMNLASDGAVVLRSARPRYELSELVSGIKPGNRHPETDGGQPKAREPW